MSLHPVYVAHRIEKNIQSHLYSLINFVSFSAGIGRTGTFIALDLLTFKGEALGYVDIFGCLTDLRSQRVNLVQTPVSFISGTSSSFESILI